MSYFRHKNTPVKALFFSLTGIFCNITVSIFIYCYFPRVYERIIYERFMRHLEFLKINSFHIFTALFSRLYFNKNHLTHNRLTNLHPYEYIVLLPLLISKK